MDSPISGVSYSDNTLIRNAVASQQQVTFHEPDKGIKSISREKFSNPVDYMSISAHGKKLNEYYKSLDNDSAISGLRHASSHFATNNNGALFDNFMKMAEEFNTEAKSEDASYFEKTFSEVKEIKDKNLNSDKWLDTVATIDNIDDQKSFIDITKNITDQDEADSKLQKEVFNKLLQTANAVINTSSEPGKLSDFFSTISDKRDLSEIKATIENYNYNMINPR